MSEAPLSEQHKGPKDRFQSLNPWSRMFPGGRTSPILAGILKHGSVCCYCAMGRQGRRYDQGIVKEQW